MVMEMAAQLTRRLMAKWKRTDCPNPPTYRNLGASFTSFSGVFRGFASLLLLTAAAALTELGYSVYVSAMKYSLV